MPEIMRNMRAQLEDGCACLALAITPAQLDLLMEYLALLEKWNKSYNLTAIRDVREMVTRHLLDSLAIASFVTEHRLLDVGTGAGLPGVPLAILYPDTACHLLDSNGKKTRFLFQVKTALGLDNITVHHTRVESLSTPAPYDVVMSRAFASLVDMVGHCRHALAPNGRLLAMKGPQAEQELSVLGDTEFTAVVHAINVPGLAESRHLVELRPREALQCPPSLTLGT